MKKNNVMRIASALLVAVLLTTCAISGTFAKYTTSFSGNSAARVAKWGFTDPTNVTFDLFADTYNDGAIASLETDDQGNKVNVIAPGASGSFSITLVEAEEVRATEVAYRFNVDITKSNETNDVLLAKLVWKLDGQKVGTNGTFEELQAAINALDGEYLPGTAPSATTLNISWEWVFEVESNTTDASDTELGVNGEYVVEISFTFSATQIETVTTEAETTEAAGE